MPDTRRRTEWTLDVPDGAYATPNTREHRVHAAAHGKVWRESVGWLAKAAHIPSLDRIRVQLVMIPADRRRRDEDNLVSGVLKHMIDGLVDAGVVPDDTPDRVVAEIPRIVTPQPDRKFHRWLLTVTAIPGPSPAVEEHRRGGLAAGRWP